MPKFLTTADTSTDGARGDERRRGDVVVAIVGFLVLGVGCAVE